MTPLESGGRLTLHASKALFNEASRCWQSPLFNRSYATTEYRMRREMMIIAILMVPLADAEAQCIPCTGQAAGHCTWKVTAPSTPLVPPPPPTANLGGSVGGGVCSARVSATGGAVEGVVDASLPPSANLVQEKCSDSDTGYSGRRFFDSLSTCTCHSIEENLLLSVHIQASALFSGTANSLSRIEVDIDCEWISTLGTAVEANADLSLRASTGTTGSWGVNYEVLALGVGFQSGPNPYTQSPVPVDQTLMDVDVRSTNAGYSEVDGIGLIHLIADMAHQDSTVSTSAQAKVDSFTFQAVWFGDCPVCSSSKLETFSLP